MGHRAQRCFQMHSSEMSPNDPGNLTARLQAMHLLVGQGLRFGERAEGQRQLKAWGRRGRVPPGTLLP